MLCRLVLNRQAVHISRRVVWGVGRVVDYCRGDLYSKLFVSDLPTIGAWGVVIINLQR